MASKKPAHDVLCIELRTARERLRRAQVQVEPLHRALLQDAIDDIDRVGAFSCADWSSTVAVIADDNNPDA